MPAVLDSRIYGKDKNPSSDPFEIVKFHLPSIVFDEASTNTSLAVTTDVLDNYLAVADHKLLEYKELPEDKKDTPNVMLMQLFQKYTIKPARDITFMNGDTKITTIKAALGGTIGELANETVVTRDAVLTGVTMPDDPVKEGYTFIGWNTKPDGSGESFTKDSIIKCTMPVYAIFTKKVIPNPNPVTPQSKHLKQTPKTGDEGSWGALLYTLGFSLASFAGVLRSRKKRTNK